MAGLVLPQPPPRPAAWRGNARETSSAGNVKPRSPSYKPRQLSPAGSLCQASLRTRAKCNTGIFAVMGTKPGPGGRGTAVTGVHGGDQPRLPGTRMRRKASPTLHPVTSAMPHVSSGRAGGIPALRAQKPPCPALLSPRLRPWLQVIFLSFHPGKMLQPGSEAGTCATQRSPGALQRRMAAMRPLPRSSR